MIACGSTYTLVGTSTSTVLFWGTSPRQPRPPQAAALSNNNGSDDTTEEDSGSNSSGGCGGGCGGTTSTLSSSSSDNIHRGVTFTERGFKKRANSDASFASSKNNARLEGSVLKIVWKSVLKTTDWNSSIFLVILTCEHSYPLMVVLSGLNLNAFMVT